MLQMLTLAVTGTRGTRRTQSSLSEWCTARLLSSARGSAQVCGEKVSSSNNISNDKIVRKLALDAWRIQVHSHQNKLPAGFSRSCSQIGAWQQLSAVLKALHRSVVARFPHRANKSHSWPVCLGVFRKYWFSSKHLSIGEQFWSLHGLG